jgi:hypothetical protein
MALRFLERELRQLLSERDQGDLAEDAVGSVGFTDDGATIYVHLQPKLGWPHRAQGRAYVLAWEDYVPAATNVTYCYRWLVEEARRSLNENLDEIIRWLHGR